MDCRILDKTTLYRVTADSQTFIVSASQRYGVEVLTEDSKPVPAHTLPASVQSFLDRLDHA